MSNGNVPVLVPPQFAKFMAEFFGDKRGVLWPVGNVSQIPFTLDVAKTQQEFEIEGDFFYADSDSTGTIYIKINNPAMPWIPVRTNFGIYGFPIRRIFVKWAAQSGKIVNLLYGYGAQIVPPNQDITTIGSITNPVTLSTWLGKNRTYSPGFIASLTEPSNAGAPAMAQLWNPAASGINLYVDRIIPMPHVAGTELALEIRSHTSALTTLDGNGANKRLGATNSNAEVRSTAAAILGTLIGKMFATNQPTTFEEPIIIPPNFGLIISTNATNISTTATIEWREGL